MAYILMLLGMLLILLSGKNAVKQLREKENFYGFKEALKKLEQRMDEIEKKIVSLEEKSGRSVFKEIHSPLLEEKINNLTLSLSKIERKLDNFGEMGEKLNVDKKFEDYVRDAEADDFQKIRTAFEMGKTIDEIAEEFGRGKGEVELILNLKR
ncbi:MAG TPA: hypothetical protein DEA47_02085 [Peptococcaceae bacterium]|nr:MAG: hypothetical protein XD50_0141 [Clostridia bacterium 41_269]HBT20148.1 hypothetical protein [Peptococcaceae bacterium]